MPKPILWIVIPCYNEEAVLPITAPLFLQKINDLAARGLVSDRSRVLFVNDGSKDKTWELIQGFAKQDEHFIGIAQSRNRGHQNAVLAGLMEALHSGSCDITISIDCDGQDDINAMDEMVQKYLDAGMTHSETLMPMIDTCLKTCGMTCADIDLYGVNAGPGSFTGLRIGLAAVKGLAFPRETLCAPVSTLEALAAAHTGEG